MFDVSSFLLRWMFLSNLCRDVGDIQTLPPQPYHPPPPPPPSSMHHQNQNHHHPLYYDEEKYWKEQCLRGILSHPPGLQRTLVMDAIRLELVEQLAYKLSNDQDILRRNRLCELLYQQQQQQKQHASRIRKRNNNIQINNQSNNEDFIDDENNDNEDDDTDDLDPYLDVDLEILHSFDRDTDDDENDQNSNELERIQHDNDSAVLQSDEVTATTTTLQPPPSRKAALVIGENGTTNIMEEEEEENELPYEKTNSTNVESSSSSSNHYNERTSRSNNNSNGNFFPNNEYPKQEPPPIEQVREAQRSMDLVRNYLPQLVSAILKSPAPFHDHLANPIQRLRSLILNRCANDPSAGIELCWLLEADVGKAWKTLFEHRQQTGRRLIVVLPAEKAAVLAKIGMEKREAFDLLQDVEQATAYGYTNNLLLHHQMMMEQQQQYQNNPEQQLLQHFEEYNSHDHHHRLPSSISLRRCGHFGDTMHFIDSLTKISADLRQVPETDRYTVLHNSLYEINRRMRRRMVTHGDISLDVEDNRSPYDWPHIEDISIDQIPYSIHLPLIPQAKIWPDGDINPIDVMKQKENHAIYDPFEKMNEAVRVLNIVVPETKILASRERCPFLIHVEVADSGLEASDARLYATGAKGLGATVGEALNMKRSGTMRKSNIDHSSRTDPPPFGVPEELLFKASRSGAKDSMESVAVDVTDSDNDSPDDVSFISDDSSAKTLPRGGWQGDNYDDYPDLSPDLSAEYWHDPYDAVRQHEYEQLHHHLHYTQPQQHPPPDIPSTQPQILKQKVSVGKELLDKIFGQEWSEKCREIRSVSPFGHVKGWRLASFIMKAGEDIRREAFVMQIISKLQAWFLTEIPEKYRPFMRPYTIMCVGADAGILECLSDAKSIDEVKKRTDGFKSLRDYFERSYGPPRGGFGHHHQHQMGYHHVSYGGSPSSTTNGVISFETAQDNFLRSLVGYSLVCYILQIKDRHNANILLDRVGHIMHIDFGFVLGDTPKMAKVPIFYERAPFKLNTEFWEVLGGWNIQDGGLGVKFCKMFELAFECASSHADEIATLTEAAMLTINSNPRVARTIANGVRSRLRMRGPPGSRQQKTFVMEIVNSALTSVNTSTYDWLQRNMNGYQ